MKRSQSPRVEVRQCDITAVGVDAIVNAANSGLRAGGGVCGAIFDAAGDQRLSEACRAIGGCPTGSAVATPAFDLEDRGVRHIIHAVGPIWDDQQPERCDELLRSAYESSLAIAEDRGLFSIAFPSISTGIYRFPRRRAAAIATSVTTEHLGTLERIILVAFDTESFEILDEALEVARRGR